MRPEQKILTTTLWILAVMGMVCVVGAKLWNRHGESAGSDVYVVEEPDKNDGPIGTVPEFSLLDQNAQPFTKQALTGHPFIADFIYTHCAGPCPVMTEKMAALQKQLPQMRFISVSVDPTNDTPAVLKEYAKQHHADESSWHFLTGKDDVVFALARGMLISAAPATKDSQIVHTEKFLLCDGHGQIRKVYQSSEADEMAKLPEDARQLLSQTK